MSDDTRSRILREAETLIRTRGYAAFSYADLSERVGVRKASVHYYFPAKEDLIVVLVREYIERFVAALAAIRQKHAGAPQRLRTYAGLFLDGFEQGKLPLCGALSAERAALPAPMHPVVTDFFRIHLDWIDGVLEDGVVDGSLRTGVDRGRHAMLLLSTLEGGSFVGWALQDAGPVLAAFDAVLEGLLPVAPPRRRSSGRPSRTPVAGTSAPSNGRTEKNRTSPRVKSAPSPTPSKRKRS